MNSLKKRISRSLLAVALLLPLTMGSGCGLIPDKIDLGLERHQISTDIAEQARLIADDMDERFDRRAEELEERLDEEREAWRVEREELLAAKTTAEEAHGDAPEESEAEPDQDGDGIVIDEDSVDNEGIESASAGDIRENAGA